MLDCMYFKRILIMKIPRLLMLLCAGFWMFPPPLFSQEKEPETTPLAGVWQQVVISNDGLLTTTQYVPFFKILGKEGSFCNLQITNGKAFYTQEGTYTVTSDSTYTESIEHSPILGFSSLKNPLKYRLEKENRILFVQWSKGGRQFTEMWVRVGRDTPFLPAE